VSYSAVRGNAGRPIVGGVRTFSSVQTSFCVPRCIRSNSGHMSVHVAVGVKACESALGLSGSAMIPLAIASARSRFRLISSYRGERDEVTRMLFVSRRMLGWDVPCRIVAASCLESETCRRMRLARLAMDVCRHHLPLMLLAQLQAHSPGSVVQRVCAV
jgi:hypothetical protein